MMKKLICMVLALIMVMSLCACGEGTTDNGSDNGSVNGSVNETGNPSDNDAQKPEDETQGTTAPPEPTSEEKALLENYVNTVAWLNSAAANLEAAPHSDPDRVQRFRTDLLELDLDTVKKWADTEWAERAYERSHNPEDFNFPADFDCDAVLARFVKVENVKLSYTETTTDFLGNVDGPREESAWHYFANGTIRRVDREFDSCPIAIEREGMANTVYNIYNYPNHVREYDADGRLTKISYYNNGDKVALVRLFAYDAEGKLTTQTEKSNTNERVFNYSYDAQGRLAEVKNVSEGSLYTYTYEVLYTYDANGNLTKEEFTTYQTSKKRTEITNRYIMEYVYDASGKLVTGTYTDQDWSYTSAQGNYIQIQKVDQYTYELDAQGRVMKATVIPGDFMWAQRNEVQLSAQYAQIVYETVYGDYYVYIPAK